MIYVGHFSFDEVDNEEQPRHGYFSIMTNGSDPEDALQQFKTLIQEMKKKESIFEKILAVYIEDIIEIPKIPDKAFMTTFQSSSGEFPESVSVSLPNLDSTEIKAYGYAIDIKQFRQKPEHAFKETTPYLDFHKYETPKEKL